MWVLYGMVLSEVRHDEQAGQEHLLDAQGEKPCKCLLLEQIVQNDGRREEIQDVSLDGTGITDCRHKGI